MLAVVFCAAFLGHRGLYGETVFVELSQTRSWWAGFVYPYDPQRRFLSLPMHLGYLASDGSYDALNAVFGLSVLATGVLTFLLVRVLVPHWPLVAFASGAIAIAHGADRMANFVPGVQVRFGVVAGLAAIHLGVLLCRGGWAWLLAPMFIFQVISLWTYEPVFPALALAPVLIWSIERDWRSWLRRSMVWELVPCVWITALVYRYAVANNTSYQATKLTPDWSPGLLAGNLGSIVSESLTFWRWPMHWLELQAAACAPFALNAIWLPLAAGTVASVGTAVWLLSNSRSRAPQPSGLMPILLTATLFAVLTALPFALLRNAWNEGGPWRTQFYLAIPSAVLLATVVAWIGERSRVAAAVAFAAIIACGLSSGLIGQLVENGKWQGYRRVMAAVVEAAPRVEQDSMMVLVNVPAPLFGSVCPGAAPFDPFSGDQLWFNSGLQVLYPETRLVGLYWNDAGKNPGSIEYAFDGAGASLVKASTSVEGEAFAYSQMLAFSYHPDRGAVLMDRFPAEAIPGSVADGRYAPANRILAGPPPIETRLKLREE